MYALQSTTEVVEQQSIVTMMPNPNHLYFYNLSRVLYNIPNQVNFVLLIFIARSTVPNMHGVM